MDVCLAESALVSVLKERGFLEQRMQDNTVFVFNSAVSPNPRSAYEISCLTDVFFGFKKIEPLHIINEYEDTDFISAGVNLFNSKSIYSVRQDDFLVTQPCVRTQALEGVSMERGFSSSFINICSLKRDASVDDFVEHVGAWCGLFEKIGLSVEFEPKVRQKDWGYGAFSMLFARVSSNGREIGDVCYIDGLPVKGARADVVDCGFGLERLAWSTGLSYSDACGLIRGTESQDCLKTACLLIGSGIMVSNRGRGYFLSKVLGGVRKEATLADISHFHQVWSQYTDLQRTPKAIMDYFNFITG